MGALRMNINIKYDPLAYKYDLGYCPLMCSLSLHLPLDVFLLFTHAPLPLKDHLASNLVLTEMPKLLLLPISEASPRS